MTGSYHVAIDYRNEPAYNEEMQLWFGGYLPVTAWLFVSGVRKWLAGVICGSRCLPPSYLIMLFHGGIGACWGRLALDLTS